MAGTGGFKTANQNVSPEQMALANYNFGENRVQNANAFSSGTGMSTMHTQADVGAAAGQAYDVGKMDIADANAMTAFNNQLKSQAGSNIGALGSLAGAK